MSNPSAVKASEVDFSIKTLFDVHGRVALVTGGGSGIGKMIATALVQNGCKVYIASRKFSAVDAAAKELTAIGPGKCIALQADLTTKDEITKLADAIKARESKLHILVNNSGMSWGSSFLDFDEKNGFDRLFAVNVKSVFMLTAALTPLLSKGANGNLDPARVINISSVAGIASSAEDALSAPGNGTWSYAASKSAVNQITRTLVGTLAPYNITINAIAPGVFPSKMTKFGIEKGLSELTKQQPLGRIGRPSEMAGLALFLCSPAGAHLNGTIIPIDGGAHLVTPKL